MNEYKKKFAEQAGKVNHEPAQEQMTNGIPNSVLNDVFAGKKKATSEMMGRRMPLPPSIAAKMQQSFGMDLTQLSVYRSDAMVGTGMHGMAQGNKVVLGSDVNLNTTEGQAVLGHELSHIRAQSQGIGMGHGGLYNNAALEHQADVEGLRAAQGRPIYQDNMVFSDGMKYGLGMKGVEGLSPLSAGLGATAAAPMQAEKEKNNEHVKALKAGAAKVNSGEEKKGRTHMYRDNLKKAIFAFGLSKNISKYATDIGFEEKELKDLEAIAKERRPQQQEQKTEKKQPKTGSQDLGFDPNNREEMERIYNELLPQLVTGEISKEDDAKLKKIGAILYPESQKKDQVQQNDNNQGNVIENNIQEQLPENNIQEQLPENNIQEQLSESNDPVPEAPTEIDKSQLRTLNIRMKAVKTHLKNRNEKHYNAKKHELEDKFDFASQKKFRRLAGQDEKFREFMQDYDALPQEFNPAVMAANFQPVFDKLNKAKEDGDQAAYTANLAHGKRLKEMFDSQQVEHDLVESFKIFNEYPELDNLKDKLNTYLVKIQKAEQGGQNQALVKDVGVCEKLIKGYEKLLPTQAELLEAYKVKAGIAEENMEEAKHSVETLDINERIKKKNTILEANKKNPIKAKMTDHYYTERLSRTSNYKEKEHLTKAYEEEMRGRRDKISMIVKNMKTAKANMDSPLFSDKYEQYMADFNQALDQAAEFFYKYGSQAPYDDCFAEYVLMEPQYKYRQTKLSKNKELNEKLEEEEKNNRPVEEEKNDGDKPAGPNRKKTGIVREDGFDEDKFYEMFWAYENGMKKVSQLQSEFDYYYTKASNTENYGSFLNWARTEYYSLRLKDNPGNEALAEKIAKLKQNVIKHKKKDSEISEEERPQYDALYRNPKGEYETYLRFVREQREQAVQAGSKIDPNAPLPTFNEFIDVLSNNHNWDLDDLKDKAEEEEPEAPGKRTVEDVQKELDTLRQDPRAAYQSRRKEEVAMTYNMYLDAKGQEYNRDYSKSKMQGDEARENVLNTWKLNRSGKNMTGHLRNLLYNEDKKLNFEGKTEEEKQDIAAVNNEVISNPLTREQYNALGESERKEYDKKIDISMNEVQSREYYKKLTTEERLAMMDYTEDYPQYPMYQNEKDKERQSESTRMKYKAQKPDNMSDEDWAILEQKNKALENMVDKYTTPYDFTVWRAIHPGKLTQMMGGNFDESNLKSLQGKVIRDPSFISTTTRLDSITQWPDTAAILEIEVDKGTRVGAPVGRMSANMGDEHEFLMQPGIQLLVTGFGEDVEGAGSNAGQKIPRIHCKVVGGNEDGKKRKKS